MNLNLDLILQSTKGTLIFEGKKDFLGVSTDSRAHVKGKLFIPLKGDTHDGHDHIESAIQNGAAGFLTHKDLNLKKESCTQIKVTDTLKALQNLSHAARKKWGGPIVAVTGSNGKTTTKTYLHQMLNQWHKCHSNQGSFNNHWGVPLTLLDLPEDADSAVVEMGMNHEGEITTLCQIAEPNIVGVLNVGRAHLGHFKNQNDIANSKAEIYQSAKIQGQIFNLDNEHTKKMYEKYKAKANYKTFSLQDKSADVFFKGQWAELGIKISGTINGIEGSVEAPIWGLQNISNLGFAAAAAGMLGMPTEKIWQSLTKVKESWGRNQWLEFNGAKILFDGYNANPESFNSLFQNLKDYAKNSDRQLVGVFGDMREMGEFREQVHIEVAKGMAHLPFKSIFYLGDNQKLVEETLKANGFKNNFFGFSKFENSSAEKLKSQIDKKTLIVLKASRGIKIESFLTGMGVVLPAKE